MRGRARCPGVGKLLKISPACCHVAQVKRISVIFIRQGKAARATTPHTTPHPTQPPSSPLAQGLVGSRELPSDWPALRGDTQSRYSVCHTPPPRCHTQPPPFPNKRCACATHPSLETSPQEKIRVLLPTAALRPRETCDCSSRGARQVARGGARGGGCAEGREWGGGPQPMRRRGARGQRQ